MTKENYDSVNDFILKKERFSFFETIKKLSMKNDTPQIDIREEGSNVDGMNVKNNDSVNNDENDQGNAQNYRTKVVNFYNKRLKELRNVCVFQGFNRTTLKLSFVSISYLIIYLPWFFVRVSKSIKPTDIQSDALKYVYLPIFYFPFAGCAVNPVIYAFVDPKFRSQCRDLFR